MVPQSRTHRRGNPGPQRGRRELVARNRYARAISAWEAEERGATHRSAGQRDTSNQRARTVLTPHGASHTRRHRWRGCRLLTPLARRSKLGSQQTLELVESCSLLLGRLTVCVVDQNKRAPEQRNKARSERV